MCVYVRACVCCYVCPQVFQTLGTETTPSSAAQCVAYIAAAELPHSEWPELVEALLANVTTATHPEAVKEATLEAIGYICEEINPQVRPFIVFFLCVFAVTLPNLLVELDVPCFSGC